MRNSAMSQTATIFCPCLAASRISERPRPPEPIKPMLSFSFAPRTRSYVTAESPRAAEVWTKVRRFMESLPQALLTLRPLVRGGRSEARLLFLAQVLEFDVLERHFHRPAGVQLECDDTVVGCLRKIISHRDDAVDGDGDVLANALDVVIIEAVFFQLFID